MRLLYLSPLCLSLGLVACGGGGGGTGPIAGVQAASQRLAQICAKENYFAGDATTATRVGDLAAEKSWVQAYMNERYFWYRDIPSVDPAAAAYNVQFAAGGLNTFASIDQYFAALRNPQRTASGRLVDQFSFVVPTVLWNGYFQGEGVDFGWKLAQRGTGANRRIFVTYVYPSTQPGLAGPNGMERGDEIISIDGIRANDPTRVAEFDARLKPSNTDAHTFVMTRGSNQLSKTLSAVAADLPQAEYRVVDQGGVRWGYLLFNSHVQGVETYLTQAMAAFKAEGVTQLAVDLRYNSGGYLSIASGLAYAVAGEQKAQGRVFEKTRFNDKRSAENGDLLFSNVTLFGNLPYATLNLSKIYVLTTGETCSASESFINGLRGIDVEVEVIGGTTCGKPYGFYPQDNCGLTYGAMEFEGVNAKGQGGFSDGLAPTCSVSDDLSRALGDPTEALFAKAIARQRGASCGSAPASLALSSGKALGGGTPEPNLRSIQPEWKRQKFLLSSP